MANNTVNQINSPNTVVITDRDQNQILVTQPVTQVLEVGAVGPQGQKGDTGPQGPQGEPGPQGPPGSLEAFEGIIVTGSSIFSGSTEFTNLPTIQVTGSFAILGTGSLNGSGILTSVFTASYNTFTASYYTDSSSFSTRVTSLEAFSASLDNTFVTETELNAATSSLSASIAYLSSSYLASSASFDTRISNNSSSVVLLSGSFLAFSGSYITDSASFASRITNNSASIVALSSSFLNLSSSFLTNSSSFAARISNNSASLSFLSASYVAFSSSYNTGSFTGSFTGNGAGLYNIPASGIVGLNLSQIASGSATASISPVDGFRVNTNTIITGSLTVSGSSTLINIGPAVFTGSLIVTQGITGSLLGTASYAANALTSSYAITASYAENAGSGTQIASGSATASISGIDGFRINTNTVVTGSLTATGGLTASAAIISGDVIVQGTASINTLVVNQTQYTSGSNQLGDGPEDVQTLFGTVRIPTGSLIVTGSVFITGSTVALEGGSFSGSGANLFNIPASGITGLNLSQIATGSVTASVSPGTGSFRITSGSTNLLFVSSSGNVGIGTTTPAYNLDVITPTGSTTIFRAINPGAGASIHRGGGILVTMLNTQVTGGRTRINQYDTSGYGGLNYIEFVGGSGAPTTEGSTFINGFYEVGLGVGGTKRLSADTSGVRVIGTFNASGVSAFASNVTITGSATNSLLVRGSGTTASTTSLLVQNSAGAQLLNVRDDQYVLVNTLEATQIRTNNVVSLQNQNLLLQSPWADSTAVTIETITNKAQVLIVRPTANLTLTSGTHDTQRITHTFAPTSGTGVVNALTLNQTINQTGGANGITRGLYVNPTLTAAADFRAIETTSGSVIFNGGNVGIGVSSPNFRLDVSGSSEFIGNVQVTGSTFISASASTSSAALQVYKSGSTVLNVEGSSGQLFSITDSLTGSLFSVNTVAGLPVIEAFSDNTVNIGKFGIYPIKVAATGTLAVITGSLLGTASFALTASSLSGTVATSSFALTASYVNPLTQSVLIRGLGTTSATTALSVQNANASSSLSVLDNGFVGIGVSIPSSSLDVRGQVNINNPPFAGKNLNVGGNIGLYGNTVGIYSGDGATGITWGISNVDFTNWIGFNSSYIFNFTYSGGLLIRDTTSGTRNTAAKLQVDSTGSGFLQPRLTTTQRDAISTPPTGLSIYNTSLGTTDTYDGATWQRFGKQTYISGSAGTGSALTVYKSGSTVVSIQGSQGELFSITDSLSGSLFSVSNISGLPILEVFSDNTVLLGNYLDPMLITTQLVTANSGSTVIYSLPTASYDGAFYEYVIKSGSNARAGTVMAVWAGTSTQFTDNSTLDLGSTSGFSFGVFISGSNMVLTGSASTSGWNVKTIIRSI